MAQEDRELSIEQYDLKIHWRCRQLGGQVSFRYCRRLNEGLPCAALIECWKTIFDVRSFVERHYSPDQLAEIRSQPRPDTMVQLVGLVDRAIGLHDQYSEPNSKQQEEDRGRT